MVKKIRPITVIRLLSCLLTLTLTLSVSAQSFPQRGQGSYPSRVTRSTRQSDLGETLVKGGANQFKKKDKNKDKKQSTVSTTRPMAEDEVELMVSADGQTKEQATLSALRSALEQAFGTFVSANSTILNDELVKDEIVTVSTGNIKEYHYLSENEVGNKYYVTIKAIVSVGNLVQYVKSKGGETELAGATFAMNLKMQRLQKENQEKAEKEYIELLLSMTKQANLFDYEIKIGEPQVNEKNERLIEVPYVILCAANKNFDNLIQFRQTSIQNMSWVETHSDVNQPHIQNLENIPIQYYLESINVSLYKPYLNYENLLKFKIVDNIAEYPFYKYTIHEPNSIQFVSGLGGYIRVDAPEREIDLFILNDEKPVRTFLKDFSHGHLYSSIRKSGWPLSHNFGDLLSKINVNKYDVLILGRLFYTEEDIEKISNISVVPTTECKEGKYLLDKSHSGRYEYYVYDDEVDYFKTRGHWPLSLRQIDINNIMKILKE